MNQLAARHLQSPKGEVWTIGVGINQAVDHHNVVPDVSACNESTV